MIRLPQTDAFRAKFRMKHSLISGRLQLGVFFDEFLCAAAGEAHGDATIVVVLAFDAHHGSDAVFRMADFASEHGIGGGAAPRGGTAKGAGR